MSQFFLHGLPAYNHFKKHHPVPPKMHCPFPYDGTTISF